MNQFISFVPLLLGCHLQTETNNHPAWHHHYCVMVLSVCLTSCDKRKIDEMLRYYESKGCKIMGLNDLLPI